MTAILKTAIVAAIAGSAPLTLAAAPMNFSADLTPLNDSGVSGRADLTLDGAFLDVSIVASGLEPGQLHVQHIHGLVGDDGANVDSVSPPASEPMDTEGFDGDGFVELEEGVPFYGPIQLSLEDGIGDGTGNFPTAPDGTINFSNTYELSEMMQAVLNPLDFREIVLHGAFVPDRINDRVGEDGYLATLPVAAGEIVQAPAPVPVPAAGVLLIGALGGLGAMRLRKRS